MNILIIEDESHAARLLIDILSELRAEVKLLAVLDSVKSSLNWLASNHSPLDLIFMDIELADGNSLEIFNHSMPEAPVIFTTAYNHYAVEAFKVNALDYLLKPIEPEALAKALTRWEGHERNQLSMMQGRLEEMATSFRSKSKNRCLVKKGGVFEFINVEDIALAYSENSVTFLITFDGKRHIYSRTIEQLADEIDPLRFFQINRAQLVSVDNIIQVHPYLGQRLKLKVKCHSESIDVIVSRQRASEFKQWLDS